MLAIDRSLKAAINASRYSTIDTKLIAVIMHSGVDTKQTTYALQESTRNERKIVLATNMAESSITVPNLKYGAYPTPES